MKCCGVDIAGNQAILVTIEQNAGGKREVVKTACNKIALKNSADQNAVRAFFNAVQAFAKKPRR
jgi:DUF3010 family protein